MSKEELVYTERRHMLARGKDGQERVPVPDNGTLLVSDRCILMYEDPPSKFGVGTYKLFPAFYNGKRAFLLEDKWVGSGGCAGTKETIIYFEAGVKMLLERGCYEFPQPQPAVAREADRYDLVCLRKQVALLGNYFNFGLNDTRLGNLKYAELDALAENEESGWEKLADELVRFIRK